MERRLAAALLLGSDHSSDTTRGSHRTVLAFVVAVMLAVTAAAQAPPSKPVPAAARPAASSGVDTVIALVKGGMSEALVVKTLKREGRVYTLSAADLLKLQKGGVSENIIEVMTDPGAAVTPAVPASRTRAVVPAVRT